MDREEEKIKIIKTLIFTVIIAVLLIIGSLIYNYYFKDDGAKSSNKYLILGNYLILQKTNTSFKQIKELDDDVLKNEYTITDGKNNTNNVTIQFLNNQWHFFDKDYNEVSMPDFKAATHNMSVKLANFNQEIIENPLNDEYLLNFFEMNKIPNEQTYSGYITTYDLDKDGNEELIYTISNYSLSATDYEQNGFIFMVKDDQIINLNDNDGKGPYTVMQILDLDNDNNYEIIINKGSVNLKTFDSCYQIYSQKNNKWNLIKDCK